MAERNYVREYIAAQKAKPKNSMMDIIRQLRAGFDNNPDNRNMLSDKYLYDRSAIYKSIKDAVTAPMRAYEGEFDVNSPYAVQEALNTAGIATLGGMPGGARGPGSVGATVWHGSPHKFDKFDMSKIGTGEGAQAYGHGLYMAENPTVAKEYGMTTKNGTFVNKLSYDGEIIQDNIRATAAKLLQEAKGDKAAAMKAAENYAYDNLLIPHIKDLDPSRITAGNLYKVDIPDESIPRMLDWDKPLSVQAPEVREAVANGMRDFGRGQANINDVLANMNGQQALQYLMPSGNRAQASEVLAKHNVPGIRYLDGGSRGAGEGTSNFVLFNDQLPRILERNGEPTGLRPWAPGEANALLGILEQSRPRNGLGQEIPPTRYESRIPWMPLGAGTLAGMLGMSDDAEANALRQYIPR